MPPCCLRALSQADKGLVSRLILGAAEQNRGGHGYRNGDDTHSNQAFKEPIMNLVKQLWRLLSMTRRAGGWQALLQQGPKQVALFQRLLRDTRVPALAKAVLVGAAVFAVSPLNFPQYIPVVGAMDDIGIALLAIKFFLGQVPQDVLSEHRQAVGLDPVSSKE